MKTRTLIALGSTACLLLSVGCVPVAEGTKDAATTGITGHEGGAYSPRNTAEYDLENHSKFVLLDHGVERAVTCSASAEKYLDDGRLQITVSLRNRLGHRTEVQLNCVFKDAQGGATGDESPFETLILTENSQEAVTFTSMNTLAKGYTIRVRAAR